jgi:hypothetical protein
MSELHDLLDRATADATGIGVDVESDLRRGHRALTRRRTGWAAGVTGAVVAVGAAGYTALPQGTHATVVQPAGGSTSAGPRTDLLHTPYYDVPPAPPGWHLVDGNRFDVVYRKDGDTRTALDADFEQAILVYLQDRSDPVADGPAIDYDGRAFHEWSDGGAGLESMSVQLDDGDWLRMQYPQSAGFDSADMIAFLDAVVVKEGAHAAVG